MFSDIRNFNEAQTTMLGYIAPAGDWVAGSPQLPTGDLSGNYSDALITCHAYEINSCWHTPSVVNA